MSIKLTSEDICKLKAYFETDEEALNAIESSNEHNLTVYRCPACGGFHLAHPIEHYLLLTSEENNNVNS